MDWAATMYEYTKSGRLIFFTSNGKRTTYLVFTACGWHILVTWVVRYCAVRMKPVLTPRISNRRILCFHCWRRSRRAPNETGETSIVFTFHTKYRIVKIAYTEYISVASYVRVFFRGQKIFFPFCFSFVFFLMDFAFVWRNGDYSLDAMSSSYVISPRIWACAVSNKVKEWKKDKKLRNLSD